MKIVYSYYVLDIIHQGHIIMMKRAKEEAGKDGISIVGVLSDKATMEKKSKPIISLNERLFIAEAIKYNDVVVIQDTYSPLYNIKKLKPNILMESSSHALDDIEIHRKYMNSVGGDVVVVPYYKEQSSTNIKKKIRES